MVYSEEQEIKEFSLAIHCKVAKLELMALREYHNDTELMWDNKKIEALANLENSEYESSTQEDLLEPPVMETEQLQYYELYYAIHRNSILVTICSFFESDLNKLCKKFHDDNNSAIKLKDLHGKGVNRAKIYLSKIAGFDWTRLNEEWSFILGAISLRNNIVHNQSILPKDPHHSVNKFIEQHHIYFKAAKIGDNEPSDPLFLDANFILLFIKTLLLFYSLLHDDLKEKLR